jgi:N-acetylmuramoyl-L-alanine amidase
MSDAQDREIAGIEAAEAQHSVRDHVLAAEHLSAVEGFIAEHGADALDTALLAGVLFRHLRQESRWALETAISASKTRGVDGYLVIRLPRMPSDLTEMSYITGRAQLNIGFA